MVSMASPKASPETKRARAAVTAVAQGVVIAVIACALAFAAWQALSMVLFCSAVGYATGAWLCETEEDDRG